MPLSPTDFYAYSRATGAPVAETPEERARQAPDVYAFRQAQLQGPQQSDQGGFNVLDALGKTALAAGALAGGFGLYRGLRGKGLGKAVEGTVESRAAARAAQVAKKTPEVQQTLQKITNGGYGSAEYAALFNERGFPKDLNLSGPTPPPQRVVAQAAAEPKPNLGVQITNLNTPTRVSAPLADPWQDALKTNVVPTETRSAAPVPKQPLANEFLYSQIGKILGDAPNEDIVAISKLRPFSQSQLTVSNAPVPKQPLANEFLYSQIGKILGDAPNEDIVAISKLRPFSQSQLATPSGLDAGDRFIEEYAPEYEKLVRGQARQDADVARRVRAHQMQVQGKAEQILADIRQEAAAETKAPSQAFLQAETQPNEEMLNRLVAEHAQGTAENIAGQLAGETLVDQHNTQISQHAYQSVSAVNSAEDQMTGRVKHSLQQNPDLDMSQVEVLEDMAQHSYQLYPKYDSSENYPNDFAINAAASETLGRVPNDQAEGNTASSAQRFLARERMEIASQLGEQSLPVSPGRIEAELNRRLGSQASEYGPEYTRRKQALQLGATYGGKFFENVNDQNVNVAGINWPAYSSDFKQAVINEDTANRAEEYVTRRRNQQKDWVGNIRLEAEPQINQILIERQNIARETAGKLKEQQAALLAAGDTQGAAYAERQIQNMREVWKDPFLGKHREGELRQLSNWVDTSSGKAYANMENIQKRFPTALVSDIDENKRIFFQTSSPKGTKADMAMLDPTWDDINEPVEDVVLSMGDINPYTVELRSGRRPTVENVGSYGENLEPSKMQAASGTSIRGVSGIPFITESQAEPMSALAAEQSRKAAYVSSLQPVEKTLKETQKESAQKFVDEYKGGIGLYGEVAEGYPEGAVTPEGEYTELAKQQPSLVYNKYGDVDQAANAPSVWSKYSDEALGEMSLMGINPRMRHMAEKTLMQRQSVRASEDVRLGTLQPTLEADAAKTGGKRLANALIDHKQRTGKALSSENAVDFATSIAQQEGTDVNSVLREANKHAQSMGQTSEWVLIPKGAAAEANRYFPSAGETIRNRRPQQSVSTAPEQANLQQAAARVMASSVPDVRQQAGVQHLANYISSAAKRADQPLTWQGNTKLKGVGNNALMPYAPPSEGMIQALMTQARRR